MYWIAGRSTMLSISLGMDLDAGSTRVPSPAAGMIAFLTFMKDPPYWMMNDMTRFGMMETAA